VVLVTHLPERCHKPGIDSAKAEAMRNTPVNQIAAGGQSDTTDVTSGIVDLGFVRRRRSSNRAPTQRVAVKGPAGAGKSTLVTSLQGASPDAPVPIGSSCGSATASLLLPQGTSAFLFEVRGRGLDEPALVDGADLIVHVTDIRTLMKEVGGATSPPMLYGGEMDACVIIVWNKIDAVPIEQRGTLYRQAARNGHLSAAQFDRGEPYAYSNRNIELQNA
jgi:GTPase SAR1 family protein